MDRDEVVGRHFRVYRAAAGHLRFDCLDGAEASGEEAREALQAIGSLSGGHPIPVLVDVRLARSVSREARKAFASTPLASRVALLVGSSLSRMLANFYLGMSSPSAPTRIFNDLDAAQRWLLVPAEPSADAEAAS